MKSWIGNDVVDLLAAHHRGRAGQPRFVERTLTGAERERIAVAADGDRACAYLWCAKEAAYKAAKKRDPALVFAPRRWAVRAEALAAGCEGSVLIDVGLPIAIRWQAAGAWVHCIALLGERPAIVEHSVLPATDVDADPPLSADEIEGCTSGESIAVRKLAKRLLRAHGSVGCIEVLRARCGAVRLPPRVHAAGLPLAGVDLSLSHDGPFVAAAIALDG